MDTDYKYIEELLAKYWQCETSLEEETGLRAFFSGEDVPPHLQTYKDVFVYQTSQQEIKLGTDFDERMLNLFDKPVVKAKRVTVLYRLTPLLKATAIVGFVLVTGGILRHTVLADKSSASDSGDYPGMYEADPGAAAAEVSSTLVVTPENMSKQVEQQQVADSTSTQSPEVSYNDSSPSTALLPKGED